MAQKVQGKLSHNHTLEAGSLMPPPLELALLCCPDEVQGLLSQVLQQVTDRISSLALTFLLGPALPPSTDGEGKSEGSESVPCLCHCTADKRQGQHFHAHTLEPTHLQPPQPVLAVL